MNILTVQPDRAMASSAEIASKRVALTPGTWAALSQLRKPGQTFDNLIAELIEERKEVLLVEHLRAIDAKGEFVPWDQAKRELGL